MDNIRKFSITLKDMSNSQLEYELFTGLAANIQTYLAH